MLQRHLSVSENLRFIDACLKMADEGEVLMAHTRLFRQMTDTYPTSEQWRDIVDIMHYLEETYSLSGF